MNSTATKQVSCRSAHPVDAARALLDVGYKARDAVTQLAIWWAESSLVLNIVGDRGCGGSYGPGQIHLLGAFPGWDTLKGNARASKAKKLSQGFNAWTTYRTGAYRAHLPKAEDAVARAMKAGGGGGGKTISLVDIGRRLQRRGADVGEHDAFGGVAPVHAGVAADYGDFVGDPTKRSGHYDHRAFDWGYADKRKEPKLLARDAADIKGWLPGNAITELFHPGYDPYGGHSGHGHLSVSPEYATGAGGRQLPAREGGGGPLQGSEGSKSDSGGGMFGWVESAEKIAGAALWVSDPHNWLRLGYVVAGSILFQVGIIFIAIDLVRSKTPESVKGAAAGAAMFLPGWGKAAGLFLAGSPRAAGRAAASEANYRRNEPAVQEYERQQLEKENRRRLQGQPKRGQRTAPKYRHRGTRRTGDYIKFPDAAVVDIRTTD